MMSVPELIKKRERMFPDGTKHEVQFMLTDYTSLTDEENVAFHEMVSWLDDRRLGALAAIVATEGMNRSMKKGHVTRVGDKILMFDKPKEKV